MSLPSSVHDRTVSLESIDDLDNAIRHLAGHMNAVGYRMLLLVREFDDRFGWAKWSYSTCAWRIGITLSAAREKVRVAHALRDLPLISAAFEKGRVSYSKVRALTRAANAANEEALLEYAFQANAAQVEERCRQIRNVRPESVEDGRQAWVRRALSMFRNPSRNTMTISVEVPLEDGEIVARALDKAVQSGGAAKGPEFGGDGWQAQQADALIAIAKTYLCDGGAREPENASEVHKRSVSADRYQVVVHVEEKALRRGAGRSEVPIETVRRLACDSSITVVTEDERGNPLNVVRKQRIVGTSLRRALWSRDGGCTFPGCHNKRFIDAHHLKHWTHGGETSPENTALLCTHHHRLVHDGAFDMRRLDDGSFEFRRPDGRVIPRCGYRVDDAAPDPVILESSHCPSAEAWLAALIARGDRGDNAWRGRSGPSMAWMQGP